MKFKKQPSEGSKNFLKLKAGESIRGLLVGDPYEFRQHWVDGRGSVCTGSGCAKCAEGHKSSYRFRMNFIIKENETYTAKIFEQGRTVYDDLEILHDPEEKDGYNLEKHLVKITRVGEGTDTKYHIQAIPNGALSAEQQKIFKEVPLNDLSHGPKTQDEVPF